jgi:GT2 family glycosyltransferase
MITEPRAAPTLAVSIVAFNSDLARLEATLRCLATAIGEAGDALSDCSVTVLDNASGGAYRQRLGALLTSLAGQFAEPPRLLDAPHNLGYGGGNNLALADSPADLVLILNPDIELDPAALREALITLDSHPDLVAVAPRCSDGAGEPEYLCKRYPSVLDLLLRGAAIAPLERCFRQRLARYEYRDLGDEAAPVVLMSGACMLMRGDVFRRIGGFCSEFFMYFEDFDLSLRAAEHGRLLYQPRMRAVHHGGNAARKGWRHVIWFAGSARRFFSRHGWRWL